MADTNDLALHVCALQRSGHHAVVQWIFENAEAPKCFLNHCQPDRSPFESCKVSESLAVGIDILAEREGKRGAKRFLICNYEDVDLGRLRYLGRSQPMQSWIGRSGEAICVLVIRDPFNNFASKYRWFVSKKAWAPSLDDIRRMPAMWKGHAYEAVGLTCHISARKLVVRFNDWFKDPQYRATLAAELKLRSADKGRERVAPWGPNTWGDSVDGLTFDGRASEMDVNGRWRLYQDDDFFRSLFDDELIELSNQIFGPVADILKGRRAI